MLCIQGFQGYGYDEPFTKNLSEVQKLFFKTRNIKIIFSNDEICRFCPFSTKDNTKCFKRKSFVDRFDLKVIKILNLKPKKAFLLHDLIHKIKFNNKRLKILCQKCEWKTKCLWFLEK